MTFAAQCRFYDKAALAQTRALSKILGKPKDYAPFYAGGWGTKGVVSYERDGMANSYVRVEIGYYPFYRPDLRRWIWVPDPKSVRTRNLTTRPHRASLTAKPHNMGLIGTLHND